LEAKENSSGEIAFSSGSEAKMILFTLSGHGNLDLAAYDTSFAGKLPDVEYPDSKMLLKFPFIKIALLHLPNPELGY
jgi:hypothetical protein